MAGKLEPAKVKFIEDAIASGVLLFGRFELKSGRISPYFFNAGLLHSSSLLSSTSAALAELIAHSRIPEFDVLFGPAYKGIPLAAITAVALKRDYGRECGFGYNRKEVKDHGEGGSLVGAPLRGRIVIIDDVLTSGKAIREAIDIIAQHPEAKLVGVADSWASSGSSKSPDVHLPSSPAAPTPCLTSEVTVAQWPTTPGFKGFWGWIKQRCDRIKGRAILTGAAPADFNGVQHLLNILDRVLEWSEEIPLQAQSSQRFGNLAFREFIKLVEDRLPALVNSVPLPPYLSDQILPLFLRSHAFGHPVRLDYGTGHELAFILSMWCCVVSGFVSGEDEEDELILRIFPKYLELVTALQQKFRLEPAGSHGVWGLDDFCFFPYLFGAAQLLDSSTTPAQCLQDALAKPSSGSPQFKDLYTLSLHRITLFKKGASFSEHSPLLYQLSTFPDWKKPFGGLQKMFLGEVAGKRVVVQGLWIGGWCWGEHMPVVRERERLEDDARSGKGALPGEVTRAPWAR